MSLITSIALLTCHEIHKKVSRSVDHASKLRFKWLRHGTKSVNSNFRVTLCLVFETSPCKTSYGNQLYENEPEGQTHFLTNGFVRAFYLTEVRGNSEVAYGILFIFGNYKIKINHFIEVSKASSATVLIEDTEMSKQIL